MKNDLISRSELKKALTSTPYNDYDDLIRTENLIDNAPTVEPEKAKEGELVKAYTKGFDAGVETARPQGEWKLIRVANHCGIHDSFVCPFCNYEREYRKKNFCEECGADLRGEKADND